MSTKQKRNGREELDDLMRMRFSGAKSRFLRARWTMIVRQMLDTGPRENIPGMIDEVFKGPFAKKLDYVYQAAMGDLPTNKKNRELVRQCCEDVLADTWRIPGMGWRIEVPSTFWETTIGFMIALAQMWADNDKLITISEAAKLSGKSLSTLNRMISSRNLTRYSDPREPNPQKRTRLSKNEVKAFLVSNTDNDSYTPWGGIDEYGTTEFVFGISQVMTGSHGGIRIPVQFAEENMSDAAINRGVLFGGYLYYEEDCAWAIPVYDLRKYWDVMIRMKFPHSYSSAGELEESVLETLRRDFPDYLAEKGVSLTDDDVDTIRMSSFEFNDSEVAIWDIPNYIIGADKNQDGVPDGFVAVAVPNLGTIWVDNESFERRPIYLEQCKIVQEPPGKPFRSERQPVFIAPW